MGKTIRIIFSAFVLVMITVAVWRVSAGTWSWVNWGMVLISAVCCLLIFVRFLHIFTYSYALCSIFNALLIWVARPSPATALLACLLIIYGIRLFVFFFLRYRSHAYAARAAAIAQDDQRMPIAAKWPIWFMMIWLMTFHPMSVWFVGEAGQLSAGAWFGAGLIFAGILLEAVADWQKQRRKSGAPTDFVHTGLFRRWRHPNFFGEALMQFGLIVTGLSSLSGFGDAITASVAPLYIIILMVSECGRVDAEQAARYGEQAAYRNYQRNSGSFLPKF